MPFVRFSSFSATYLTESGNSTIGWTYTRTGAGNYTNNHAGGSDVSIPASSNGSFTAPIVSGVDNYPTAGLHTSNTDSDFTAWAFNLFPNFELGRWDVTLTGTNIGAPNGATLTYAGTHIPRIRRAGTSIIFEVSTDSLTSWTIIHTLTGQTTAELFPKWGIDGAGAGGPLSLTIGDEPAQDVEPVAAGTIGYGTTSLTPAYPSGLAADDKLLLLVGVKPDTATVSTPAGWTSLGDFAGGGGTTGIDTGPTRIYAFELNATGSESGTLSVTAGTSPSVAWSQITAWRSITGAWATTTIAGGTDSTTGAAFSVTCGSDPGITAGDMCIVGLVVPTDVNGGTKWSAHSVTATSATMGSSVEISEPFSATGNDIGGCLFWSRCASGTSSAAPVVAATAGGTTTNVRGPAALIRLRSDPGATGDITGSASGVATVTGSTSGDGSITGTSSGVAATSGTLSGAAAVTATVSGVATATATAATGYDSITVTNSNLFFSPYNWYSDGTGSPGATNIRTSSTYAVTNNTGAYLKLRVNSVSSGVVRLILDTSSLTGITGADCPQLRVTVDGTPSLTQLSYSATDVTLTLASGLSAGTHNIEVMYKAYGDSTGGDGPFPDRWTTPALSWTVVGLELTTGSSLLSPTLRSRRLLCFGSSLCEAYNVSGATGAVASSDALLSYAHLLAASYDAEVGMVGWSGIAWRFGPGNGTNIPAFPSTWSNYSSGRTRLYSGLFVPTPDLVTVEIGGLDDFTDIPGLETIAETELAEIVTAANGGLVFFVPPSRPFFPTAVEGVTPPTGAVFVDPDPDRSFDAITDTTDGDHYTAGYQVEFANGIFVALGIEGTVAGTSTTAGALTGAAALVGIVPGVSSTSGILYSSIVGSSTGTASSTSTISGSASLATSISGVGTFSATIEGLGSLITALTANGTSTASIAGIGSLVASVSGIASAIASVEQGGMVGSISGASTTSASALGAGSLASISTTSSSSTSLLAGTGSLASTVVGSGSSISALLGLAPISGSSSGVASSVSNLIGNVQIAASLTSSSTSVSNLTGTSSAIASLTSSSATTGALVGTASLAGSVAGIGATVGALFSGISGSSSATSLSSSTLLGAGSLAGSSTGSATSTASFNPGEMLADTSGTSSTAASLLGLIPAVATVSGSTTQSASLTAVGAIASTLSASGDVVGILSGLASASASSAGVSSSSSIIVGLSFLSGSIAGSVIQSAVIQGDANCTGSISGTATCISNLLDQGTYSANAQGLSSVVATLTATSNASASISCSGSAAGSLSGLASLLSTAQGLSTVSATISTLSYGMVGTSQGVGTVLGSLTGFGALAGSVVGLGVCSLNSTIYTPLSTSLVYGTLLSQRGLPVVTPVHIYVLSSPQSSTTGISVGNRVVKSNSAGYFEVPVVQGAVVEIVIPAMYFRKVFTIPTINSDILHLS